MNQSIQLETIISQLDTRFMKAFCEPARLEIIKHLLIEGRADVGTLASKMTQDRSVISRHLTYLHQSGILDRKKDGRRSVYNINGLNTLSMLEDMLELVRKCVAMGCS
jgi:predicted transcriptional regulator